MFRRGLDFVDAGVFWRGMNQNLRLNIDRNGQGNFGGLQSADLWIKKGEWGLLGL
jgi:hypothetical protein